MATYKKRGYKPKNVEEEILVDEHESTTAVYGKRPFVWFYDNDHHKLTDACAADFMVNICLFHNTTDQLVTIIFAAKYCAKLRYLNTIKTTRMFLQCIALFSVSIPDFYQTIESTPAIILSERRKSFFRVYHLELLHHCRMFQRHRCITLQQWRVWG